MRQKSHDGSAQVTEAQFQQQIIDLAKMAGWLVHAERPAQYQSGRWATHIQGHAGFPDLVMVRPPRLIFAELKVGYNKLSPEQSRWLEDLGQNSEDVYGMPSNAVETYEWRPKDMATIQRILLTRN